VPASTMMDDSSDRRIALNSAKLPELLPREDDGA
jgi:hypothetical protein